MSYFSELQTAMSLLAQQPKFICIGQGISAGGHAMYNTLTSLSDEQRLEFPVAEATQLGMSIGMALEGYTVLSVFPRINFLLCAMSQLVNTLDKLPDMSQGEFCQKVIIRVGVGSDYPLDPGPQHKYDYIDGLHEMLYNTTILKLNKAERIVPAYQHAIESKCSTILVEYMDKYND